MQIKQLDKYTSFKKEVKTFLVHNAFYTIEEFFALWVICILAGYFTSSVIRIVEYNVF